MSMYKVQKYIEHIPKVLGQSDSEGNNEKGQKNIPMTNRINDNKELIEQARELGLKVPKYY